MICSVVGPKPSKRLCRSSHTPIFTSWGYAGSQRRSLSGLTSAADAGVDVGTFENDLPISLPIDLAQVGCPPPAAIAPSSSSSVYSSMQPTVTAPYLLFRTSAIARAIASVQNLLRCEYVSHHSSMSVSSRESSGASPGTLSRCATAAATTSDGCAMA